MRQVGVELRVDGLFRGQAIGVALQRGRGWRWI